MIFNILFQTGRLTGDSQHPITTVGERENIHVAQSLEFNHRSHLVFKTGFPAYTHKTSKNVYQWSRHY